MTSNHTISVKAAIAWVFAAVIVTGIVSVWTAAGIAGSSATDQADTLYENSIHACHRGNPRNRAYTLAVATAAENPNTPQELHQRFSRALHELRSQEFVREDGSTECSKAVLRP